MLNVSMSELQNALLFKHLLLPSPSLLKLSISKTRQIYKDFAIAILK